MQTRRVIVPLYAHWPEARPFRQPGDPSCVHREIEIPWVCTHCGGPRCEPTFEYRYHTWEVYCDCPSNYPDALVQAWEYLQQRPKAERNGQLRLF